MAFGWHNRKVLTTITEKLEIRRHLNISECSIDAKFVALKEGEFVLERRSVAKAQSW